MNHEPSVLMMREGAPTQPVDELVAIRRAENVIESVETPGLREASRLREELQVMIAENGRDAIALRTRPAEHLDVGGSSIDEISREPKAIPRRIKLDALEQALEGAPTALDVAHDPRAQRPISRGPMIP